MGVIRLLCISLLLLASVSDAQERSPEKTIGDFISALGKQDLSRMLDCFAIDNKVSDGSFRNTALFMYSVSFLTLLDSPPANYVMYREIGRQKRILQATKEIEKLFLYLTIGDTMYHNVPIKSDDDINRYIADVNPEKAADISVLSVTNPLSKELLAQVQENGRDFRRSRGIDDSLQPVALVKSGNRAYLIPFSLLKYGNRWYIKEFRNDFSDNAVLREISVKAFTEEIVNSPISSLE